MVRLPVVLSVPPGFSAPRPGRTITLAAAVMIWAVFRFVLGVNF